MTISSTNNRNDYTGNGSTADYDYTFRIFSDTDLEVTVLDPDSGAETELTLTTHYTVDGVGDEGGGQISLVDGLFDWIDGSGFLDTDWILTIRRVRPLTQSTDIRNQGDFYPEVHEDAFDHLVMIAQQQDEELGRALKLPVTASESDLTLPIPAAGTYLGWNEAGDALENKTLAGIDIAAFATQTEAETGTSADTLMSPLRTKQAIDANMVKASQAEAQAGSNDTHFMTPSKTNDSIQALKNRVVTLTDGATPALDASLGDIFTLSAAGDRTIAVPTNPVAGKKIIIRHYASGGARTLALNSGAGGFRFGSTITALTQTTSGKYDYIGCIYNSTSGYWEVVAYAKGF